MKSGLSLDGMKGQTPKTDWLSQKKRPSRLIPEKPYLFLKQRKPMFHFLIVHRIFLHQRQKVGFTCTFLVLLFSLVDIRTRGREKNRRKEWKPISATPSKSLQTFNIILTLPPKPIEIPLLPTSHLFKNFPPASGSCSPRLITNFGERESKTFG